MSVSEARNAAIYVRQSVNHPEGIERSLVRARKMVAQRGWTLAAEYVDNEVSASKSRAGAQWGTMLKDAKAKRFEIVVGIDMDRLVRSIQDLVTLIDLEVKVLTLDGELDLTTADGAFRGTMLAAIAQFETRRKVERQLRANEYRTEVLGLPVPGRRRYGYQTDGVTPREDEAPIVRRIFEEFLDGSGIWGIGKRLAAEGVAPGNDPKADGTPRKQIKSWQSTRVRGILNNPAYGGLMKVKGQILPSQIIPIVAPEEAAAARALLSDPARRTSPGRTVKHLLSGIARCGNCGAPLWFTRVYRCTADHQLHLGIKREKLEDSALWQTFLILTGEDVAPSKAKDSTGPLMLRIAELNRQRELLQESLTWDGVDVPNLKKQLRNLGKEIDDLNADLDAARSGAQSLDLYSVLEEAGLIEIQVKGGTWLGDLHKAYKRFREVFDALDIERKRSLIRSTVTITVQNGRSADRVHVEPVAGWNLPVELLN